MSKKVIVPLSTGFEEIEAVSVIDILRRAGIHVLVAGTTDRSVVGAHRTHLMCDDLWVNQHINEYDAIVIPGGSLQAQTLSSFDPLIISLKHFAQQNKLIAAICASPALILAPHDLLKNKRATCYPALNSRIQHYIDKPVVIDGQIITSQGPSTAIAFALAIVAKLTEASKAALVAKELLTTFSMDY